MERCGCALAINLGAMPRISNNNNDNNNINLSHLKQPATSPQSSIHSISQHHRHRILTSLPLERLVRP